MVGCGSAPAGGTAAVSKGSANACISIGSSASAIRGRGFGSSRCRGGGRGRGAGSAVSGRASVPVGLRVVEAFANSDGSVAKLGDS